jgi:hypothetical protein
LIKKDEDDQEMEKAREEAKIRVIPDQFVDQRLRVANA